MKKCIVAVLAVLLPCVAQAQSKSKSLEEQRKWENQRQRENLQRREQNNKMVDRQIQQQRYEKSRPSTPQRSSSPPPQRYTPPPQRSSPPPQRSSPPPPRYTPPPPPPPSRSTDYRRR